MSEGNHMNIGGNVLGSHIQQGGPPPQLKPSVGRVVHYQAYGTPGGEYKSVPRAATITQVNEDGSVGLCIFNPTGLFFPTSVKFSETPTPGHWNWPPRV